MSHWEAVERCVREVYYDVEREAITRAIEVDDRMHDCAQKLVDYQGYVQRARHARAPKHYPFKISPLNEKFRVVE